MKLLQKKDEPSATKKAVGPKKQRIVIVMQAIEETLSLASASMMTPAAEADTSTEAGAAEANNLESTLSVIDKVLLDIAAEETAAATEEAMAAEETAAGTEESHGRSA